MKESKERIKSAIKNTGLKLDSRRIIINLSPADTKKEGASYDLPMAIGILIANGDLKKIDVSTTIFIGELSLDGTIHKINGAFPMTLEASKQGIKKVILPKENAKEASIVQNMEVIRSKKFEGSNCLSKGRNRNHKRGDTDCRNFSKSYKISNGNE